jgi:WG repeat protein
LGRRVRGWPRRLNGLYGFVDEDGHQIVKPQYRVVGDYKFGFAQVDVDGKSGLIDRDGKIVMEPKFGFIEAIAPDRFKVSEQRQFGGRDGADDFSDVRSEPTSSGLGIVIHDTYRITSVIDLSGRQIESPTTFVKFDRNDPSIR